jgi:hypothetical protein
MAKRKTVTVEWKKPSTPRTLRVTDKPDMGDVAVWHLWIGEWQRHRPEMLAEQVLSRPKNLQVLAKLAMEVTKWHPLTRSPGLGETGVCAIFDGGCGDCPLHKVVVNTTALKPLVNEDRHMFKSVSYLLCSFMLMWKERCRAIGPIDMYFDDAVHESRLVIYGILHELYREERQRLIAAGEVEG